MRRLSLLCGGLCLVVAAAGAGLWTPPARGDAAPGSALAGYSITATAPGIQVSYDFPGASPSPQAEGEVPQSLAQLRAGPQGYALSSVAWPGPLVANIGSAAQLLGLGLPPSTSGLGDPVRAEARTGTGPPTVTNNSYPGTSMTATATPDDVEAGATILGATGPAPQTQSGITETQSVSKLTGPSTAVAMARSVIANVSLARGVVTIGSVSSAATASSNGTKADATGSTIVTDLRVGGQRAYVDQDGLHLGQGGPATPINAIATTIAKQALTSVGMKLAVSHPSIHVQGAQVTYDAGNLVLYWAPPGDPHGDTFTVTIGGASVTVSATASVANPTSSTGGGVTVPFTGSPSPLPTPSLGGAVGSPPATSGPLSASPPLASPTVAPALASHTARLPHGLPPILIILVILGSGLIAFGMWRLPDRALEGSSTVCNFGGQS